MVTIQVFDPPMCCSTGVCGPEVDPVLPRFAGDIEWLKRRGVHVERFNLSQQPDAFARNALVLQALQRGDGNGLPAILVDGQVVHLGSYPTRDQLAAWSGLEVGAEPDRAPLPSQALERCRAALQDRKLVLLCVRNANLKNNREVMRGVRDFAADARFGRSSQVIDLDPSDTREAGFLRDLGADTEPDEAIVILLAPPGIVIGQFVGETRKTDFVAAVRTATSSCRPGSGCCG